MPLSTFTRVPPIAERSEATPGLFNNIFSVLSQNLDQLNAGVPGFLASESPDIVSRTTGRILWRNEADTASVVHLAKSGDMFNIGSATASMALQVRPSAGSGTLILHSEASGGVTIPGDLTKLSPSGRSWQLTNDDGNLDWEGRRADGVAIKTCRVSNTMGHLRMTASNSPDGDGDAAYEADSSAGGFAGLTIMHAQTVEGIMGHYDQLDSRGRSSDFAGCYAVGDLPLFGLELATGRAQVLGGQLDVQQTGWYPTNTTPTQGGRLVLKSAETGGRDYRIGEATGALNIAQANITVTDRFNRANGALGANWTMLAGATPTDLAIVSNEVRVETTTEGTAQYTGVTIADDNVVEAIIRISSAGSGDQTVGVLSRVVDNNNYYRAALQLSGSTLQALLQKKFSGSFSTVQSAQRSFGTTTISLSTNRYYKLRLETSGTTLTVFLDGEVGLRGSDASLTTGGAGITMLAATTGQAAFIDDFVVYPNPPTFTTKLSIRSDGLVVASEAVAAVDGSATAPAYTFSSQTGTGLYYVTSSFVAAAAGTIVGRVLANEIRLASDVTLSWATGNPVTTADDVLLRREGTSLLINIGSSNRARFLNPELRLASDQQITWASGDPVLTGGDTVLSRAAASVVSGPGLQLSGLLTVSTSTIRVAEAPAGGGLAGNAAGTAGDIAWGSSSGVSYLYVCVSANSWMRATLNPF